MFFLFLAIFHVLLCEFLLFLNVSFLAIFQVLECAIFIFQFFQCFLPYSRSCSVFSHFLRFSLSHQNPGTIFFISQYFTYSTVSCHISNPTVCASHITHFSVIFAIIHVLACEFLIFLVCQFSRHIPGPKMYVSYFPCWWVLLPYSRF